MTFTDKIIELPLTFSNVNNRRGVLLKQAVTALVDNVPGMEMVSTATDTDAAYDATLSYLGLTIQLYTSHSTYAYVICVINGHSFGQQTWSGALSGKPAYLCLRLGSNGHLCAKITDLTNNNDTVLDLMPIRCEMSDGTVKDMVVGDCYVVGSTSVRVSIPGFSNTDITARKLFVPGVEGAYTVSVTEITGTFSDCKGKAMLTPHALTSTYGEIASFAYNGYPLYGVKAAAYGGVRCHYGPGIIQFSINGGTYLELTPFLFARIS